LSGCDNVIDKSKENLWQAAKSISGGGYEVVFDANGVETLQDSYNNLAPGGRLVVYGMSLLIKHQQEIIQSLYGSRKYSHHPHGRDRIKSIWKGNQFA